MKFFGKKLPQDTQLVPRSGIRLIKENIDFEPVGPADYRVENIKFDEILRGLQIYLAKLHIRDRVPIISSWDRLRDHLENLPNRSINFPKMKIVELPKQEVEVLQVPEYLQDEDEGMELTGDKFNESVDEGDVDVDLAVGMDVCIYTKNHGRPWVGRVIELLEDKHFIIQWFKRKTVRSKMFFAMTNSDGSPNISELEYETIMFWQFSENRTNTSFTLSNFWLENIEREYKTYDENGQ